MLVVCCWVAARRRRRHAPGPWRTACWRRRGVSRAMALRRDAGGGGRPPRLAMLVVVLLGSAGPARCFRAFHMRVRAWLVGLLGAVGVWARVLPFGRT
eukprot:1147816-Prymnesium_polylepis.1